jgi:hypothetical protein
MTSLVQAAMSGPGEGLRLVRGEREDLQGEPGRPVKAQQFHPRQAGGTASPRMRTLYLVWKG